MYYRSVASGLALLVVLAPYPGLARAADDTSKKMGKLAKDIVDELDQMKQTALGVEGFNDTGRLESSAGPLIQKRLTEELKKLGMTINPKANVYITGEFLPDKNAPEGQLGIKLVCILREKQGEILKQYTTTLGAASNEDLIKLFSLSVDLKEQAKATPQVRNEYIKKQQENPPAYTEGDKIKVRKDSPFAVKVLAAKAHARDEAFAHRPGSKEDGLTRVSLKQGEEYRLEICNASDHEIVATVTIDGLDAFEFFASGKGKPTSYLVAPRKERLIRGWKVDTKGDRAFLVGSLGNSAAAKLYKPSQSIGTITVCIYPAWKKGEALAQYDGGKDIGTGTGRPLPVGTTVVGREVGPLLEAISIRYKK